MKTTDILEALRRIADVTERTKDNGARLVYGYVGGDRYLYDFSACTRSLGFTQYDTEQDAPYFGVWVHTEDRRIVTFAEGDLTVCDCPDAGSFAAELAEMAEFYGPMAPAFRIIDAKTGQLTNCYDVDAAHGRGIPGVNA